MGTPPSQTDTQTPEPKPPAKLACEIALEYSDRVNFAMQQNGVPLIDQVRITSTHDQPIEDITLEVKLDNDEAQPWTTRLARIDPGATLSLAPERFVLSAKALAQRTEAEQTAVVCRLTSDNAETSQRFPVELLTFDQWPGIGHYPELTAAFVTPNHPKVAELLGSAREAMGRLSESDALDGYQSGSRQRVSIIAEACFNALAARGIGYINPPASFETAGQRVRLVDRLAREGFGTCLDLSLLVMSMWEQCGLHPLVLMPEGHAMPAVWTHDTHMPEVAIDEPARIRNLIELGEIIPVEATHLTQQGASFNRAVTAAKEKMTDPGAVFTAIDIRSARKRRIRPLPLRGDGEAGVNIDALEEAGPTAAATSTLDRVALADRADQLTNTPAEQDEDATGDRITRWQTKLLDLSLRNRLLNFKPTGRTIPLNVPDLAKVEDLLADGQRFTLHPRGDTDEQYLREELGSNNLHTDEPPAETAKRLLNLYRLAKSSIEETGANVLYLALGLLKWYESETSEQPRYAPLILLPVTLTRASSGGGYSYGLRLSEEPLRPNVTLLEKLRVQFGIETDGLDELPEDESGLDVELILRNFRAAIRDAARWEVVESAALGLFSFNKFLMWKDLRENIDKLKRNRLVGHLVDQPGQDFDTEPFPQPEELDEQLGPNDLLCTRDADSSQLAAVRAASERRSFVLEGPPGTGKSQTIANIIADTLARGRTVLFVAEKMAALSVVRKRLEEDGLGPFCLELHSAKASKKEVLAQLEEGLNTAKTLEPANWEATCRDLGSTRDRLNRYVRELHEPRGTGESLYQMLGRLSLLDDGPAVTPPTEDVAATTAEQLERWKEHLAELMQRGKPIDPAGAFPLRGIGQSQWSFSLPDQAKAAIDTALQTAQALREKANALLQAIEVEADPTQFGEQGLNALVACAMQLDACPGVPSALIAGANAQATRQCALQALAIGKERDAKRGQLLERYREEFLEIEALVHIDAVQRHLDRPAILRLFTAGGIKKPLRVYAKGQLPPLEKVLNDLELVRAIKRETERLSQFTDLAHALGPAWNGGQADWLQLEAQVQWADKFAKVLHVIDADPAMPGITGALTQNATTPQSIEQNKPTRQSLVLAWRGWQDAWQAVKQTLATDYNLAFPDRSAAWLSTFEQTLTRWQDHLGELNTWCAWRQARDAGAGDGLGELITLYEQQGCQLDELDRVFWRSFGKAWFNAVADQTDAVRSFNAPAHTDTINRFRGLDQRSIQLTREVISARLNALAPATPENASAQSEIGILRRELEKKSRHKPTRRLIEAMPTLLPRLKPCFLMSPLSVAQFLDTHLPPFDVVVFDEASQIPVWDAIGAIARGTEVIVVGDSKQLPPTAFFSTLDNEDEVDEDDHAIDDMESILKECNASGIPGMRLRWHYRSRHETLIAFSNHHYYQNQLHTFPSPEERSDQLGVTFRHVADGVYDRGGTRTNRVEAERVVDEVVRMLQDPANTDSIGVVTFSKVQQSLIEDLLDTKRRELPELETYFTNEVAEPVFVKNLENVQGDERDAIIFSVCYGKDQAGKASMNFGPLNKDGGERRLNVAVTRARRKLIVFSSLTADQIDLKRTRATGVRHFKTFLDYANRGPQAIAEAVEYSDERAFAPGFEQAVHDALSGKGWEVDAQVGCAGYRIDLAVRHPDTPGKYLVGIECDGANYHSAKTARDRDRLRQSVLENLGWRIERVWSTDWWVNTQGCLDRLVGAIEQALHEPKSPALPQQQAEDDAPPQSDETQDPDAEQQTQDDPEPQADDNADQALGLPVYLPAKLRTGVNDSTDVYDASMDAELIDAIAKIVEAEAPVTSNLARQRLGEAYDVRRMTDRFKERYEQVRSAAEQAGKLQAVGDDLWRPGQAPAEFTSFRVAGDDEASQRDIDDIPAIERINAAAYALEVQFGMPREALTREAARLLGFSRVTSRVSEPIEQAIDALIATGRAEEVEGMVRPTKRPSPSEQQ